MMCCSLRIGIVHSNNGLKEKTHIWANVEFLMEICFLLEFIVFRLNISLKREMAFACNSIKTHGNNLEREKHFKKKKKNNQLQRYLVSFYYKSKEMEILKFLLCLWVCVYIYIYIYIFMDTYISCFYTYICLYCIHTHEIMHTNIYVI